MTPDNLTFKRMVLFYFTNKGDPAKYVYWNEERCKELMPEWYRLWNKVGKAQALLDVKTLTLSREYNYEQS